MIGHSFGGLLTQIIAGRGLSAASVAIDPAPFRGVLPLPFSALKSSSPVLGNPANRSRAVPLTYDQFRFAFVNAVDEDEAKELYDEFAVPASGAPLFQAATANLNPWTEAKVDTKNPDRGPLLIISGEKDNTVPWSIANASYKRQARNEGVTEIVGVPDRGHSLTIDGGWREVADTALGFVSDTRSARGLAPHRLLERAAHEHLGELPAVLGAAERVGRGRGALVGPLGGGRGVGPAGERLLYAGGAQRGLAHVRERHRGRAVRCTAATPTSAQSCDSAMELQVAPSPAGLGYADLGEHLVRRQVRGEQAHEEVAGGHRA